MKCGLIDNFRKLFCLIVYCNVFSFCIQYEIMIGASLKIWYHMIGSFGLSYYGLLFAVMSLWFYPLILTRNLISCTLVLLSCALVITHVLLTYMCVGTATNVRLNFNNIFSTALILKNQLIVLHVLLKDPLYFSFFNLGLCYNQWKQH